MATSNYHALISNIEVDFISTVQAVQDGNTLIVRAVLQQSEKGTFDINEMDEKGFTLLHYAIYANKPVIVQMLANHKKTDIYKKTVSEYTPLYLACQVPGINIKIIQTILEKDPSSASICWSEKRSLSERKDITYLPIHIAAKKNRLDIMKLLLEYGANVNAVNTQRRNCLHFAADYRHDEIIKFLINETDIYTNVRDKKFYSALDLYFLNYPENRPYDVQFFYNFVDKSFPKDPVTKKYPIREILNSERTLFEDTIFLGKYVMQKFYSENNSRYYYIRKFEEYFTRHDSSFRYCLYLYLHDEFYNNRPKHLNMIPFKKATPFIFLSLVSDKTNKMVLDFFTYLRTIGVIRHLPNTKSMQHFGYIIYNLKHNAYKPKVLKRLYNVLKFFSETGFDVNYVIQSYLLSKQITSQPPTEFAWKTVGLMLPFATNFFQQQYIMKSFFTLFPSFGDLNIPYSDFLIEFFQNFGTHADAKVMNLKPFSLQHICRNKIRDVLLKKSRTSHQFFMKIEALPLPKYVINYLRFYKIYMPYADLPY